MNSTPDPNDRLPGGQRRCTAHRQDGQPCSAPAMLGTTVCRVHGGRAPQVQRAARLKLLDLIDPAIATLAREMTNPDAKPGDRIRAAENVLDRAGYPRQVNVDSDVAKDQLLQRLLQLRDQALAEQERLVDEAHRIIEGTTEPPVKESE